MKKILEEKSELAINRGNEFEGFMGTSTIDLSKEELIMVCNILYDEVQTVRFEANELRKRLLM